MTGSYPSERSCFRLARRLATLLPAMALADARETIRIHPVAGLTRGCTAVVTTRPFRAPHAKSPRVEDTEMSAFDLLFARNLIRFAVPYNGGLTGG